MSVLLLASGGLDSTVAWASLLHDGHVVRPLFVDYGHPAAGAERTALTAICGAIGSEIHEVTIRGAWSRFPSSDPLAARNAVLISIAAAASSQSGFNALCVGFVAPEPQFPDATPEFLDAMREALTRGGCELDVLAPLASLSKREVVARGLALGAPISLTYSCYQGKPSGCGMCGGCVRRETAFDTRGD